MKNYVFLFLFSFNFLLSEGQRNFSPTEGASTVIPPSPQSLMFEQYVNQPVDEMNGLCDIKIPLYEISINGLTIPITLSYHSSGIKYQQHDGDVGVGWSISAGGYRVSRSVFGLPDEQYPFYDQRQLDEYIKTGGTYPQRRDNYLGSIDYSFGTVAFVELPKVNIMDGGYDQFTYMLPSSNGHFIITDRQTKQVGIIEQNPDKISINEFEENPVFLRDLKIIDNSGFIYALGGFDEKSSLLNEYSRGLNDTTGLSIGWPLRQIISPYNQTIDFKYERFNCSPRLAEYSYASMPITDAYAVLGLFAPVSESETKTGPIRITATERRDAGYSQLLIKEINTPNERVKFIRNKRVETSEQLLNEIQVDNKFGTLRISIRFNYALPTDSNWHTLLTSIEITDGNNHCKKYNFDYYNSPAKNIWHTYPDQWGYYKPRDEHYGVESVYADFPLNRLILHEEFLNNSFISEHTTTPIGVNGKTKPIHEILGSTEFLCFGNRTENKTPHYFSLRKITYPTGGSVEFEYEPNQYYMGYTVNGCGQRIKRIISSPVDTNSEVTEYKYGENENGLGYCSVHLQPKLFVNDNIIFKCQLLNSGKEHFGYAISTREYQMKPFCSELSNVKTEYRSVSKYKKDLVNNSHNGKTVSTYMQGSSFNLGSMSPINIGDFGSTESIYTDFYIELLNRSLQKIEVCDYWLFSKPLLMNRKNYDKDGILISEENLEYKEIEKKEYSGIKVQRVVTPENIPTTGAVFNFFNSCLSYINYRIHFGDQLLSKKSKTLYTENGTIETEESYDYDDGKKITQIIRNDSRGSIQKTEIKYPDFYSESIYQQMTVANLVSPKVEEIITRDSKILKALRYNYQKNARTNNLFLPVSLETAFQNLNYQTDVTYDVYSKIGNILQYTTKDLISTSVLWGFAGKYPVAVLTNATYDEVNQVLSGSTPTPLGFPGEPGYGSEYPLSQFEALRKSEILKKSLITTYTYKPLVGMTSVTDPKGIKTRYEYDSFGNLKEVFIMENGTKKILKSYYYNYGNK